MSLLDKRISHFGRARDPVQNLETKAEVIDWLLKADFLCLVGKLFGVVV